GGGREAAVSCSLRGGEVGGWAGLVGAGRTELAEALFGLRPIVAGQVLLDGQPATSRHPSDAVEAGLLMAPEDRRLNGLVLEKSVGFNLSLPNLDMLTSGGMVSSRRERTTSRGLCDRLRIKPPSTYQQVALLSGGNQQKVVLGKWLARKPRVLILDEPTRGVDVGARSEIYGLMDELAGQGVALLMISSDMEEGLGVSGRVLGMHEGRLAGGAAEGAGGRGGGGASGDRRGDDMKRLFGVILMVAVLYAALMASDPNARAWSNQKTIASRLGFYGILTVGVGVLIVAGGIDLSIGSVVGLGAVCFGMMLERGTSPWLAAPAVLAGAGLIGVTHGLLGTRLKPPPCLVTPRGVFLSPGVAPPLS